MDVTKLSSNWKKLQANLRSSNTAAPKTSVTKQDSNGLKRKRPVVATNLLPLKKARYERPARTGRKAHKNMSDEEAIGVEDAKSFVVQKDRGPEDNAAGSRHQIVGDRINEGLCAGVEIGKYIAIDCEMVGVGPDTRESALARVSIVNYNGEQVYDSYVKPREIVTDWRTHVSGIAPKHMLHARSLDEVQRTIAGIMKDRIVVGHSVRGDFDALLLSHPRKDVRDTARHPPYRKLAGGGSPKLKILASELLGLDIQTGEHSSIEDARATMLLFRRDKEAFEREHAKRWPVRIVPVREQGEEKDTVNNKPKKKKKKKR